MFKPGLLLNLSRQHKVGQIKRKPLSGLQFYTLFDMNAYQLVCHALMLADAVFCETILGLQIHILRCRLGLALQPLQAHLEGHFKSCYKSLADTSTSFVYSTYPAGYLTKYVLI